MSNTIRLVAVSATSGGLWASFFDFAYVLSSEISEFRMEWHSLLNHQMKLIIDHEMNELDNA